MSTHSDQLESSGESPNGSDFGFTDEDDDYETLYGDEDDEANEYDDFSGSGDAGWSSQRL